MGVQPQPAHDNDDDMAADTLPAAIHYCERVRFGLLVSFDVLFVGHGLFDAPNHQQPLTNVPRHTPGSVTVAER